MIAFLLFFIFRCALCNIGCTVPDNGNLGMSRLKLGLPPNTSNAYVSGYLPSPDKWNCTQNPAGTANITFNAKAVFISYYKNGRHVAVGVGSSKSNNTWGLYFYHKNGERKSILRVCRWNGYYMPSYRPTTTTNGLDCIIDSDWKLNFADQQPANDVFGISWSGDRLIIYSVDGVHSFYVPGASEWDVVSFRCEMKQTCAHQVVTKPVTAIVSTFSNGSISNYTICETCDGFPKYVFAVNEGGSIPPNFRFDNWFYLTNSSTPISGMFTSVQPFNLTCVWPIPVLTSNSLPVYFNMSKNENATCNGYSNFDAGIVDAMRFSLNFTDAQIVRKGVISVFTRTNVYNFSCTNSSVGGDAVIPFGDVHQTHYCFINFFTNMTSGANVSQFVGVLPPQVKEFVIMRNGDFHLNGFRIFSVDTVESVIFNISTGDGRDFWTVAFANNAEVLTEINSTSIQNLLYCNNPVNTIKCQQLRFNLDDGFYSHTFDSADNLPRTIVRLPKYVTHSFINVTVGVNFQEQQLANYIINFADDDTSIGKDNRTTVCVDSTTFTTRLNVLAFSAFSTAVSIQAGDCPFSYQNLNNYLSFGSLCFSTRPNGGCMMSVVARGYLGEFQKVGVLYVSFTKGDNVLGVPPNNLPTIGVSDMSDVKLNVCTTFTIYGHTGRGVINKSNNTFVSGLFYTSVTGNLLGFKNSTTGEIFSISPCQLTTQVAVVANNIVGVAAATSEVKLPFDTHVSLGSFYYHYKNSSAELCTTPSLMYGGLGVCNDGRLINISRSEDTFVASAVISGNITIPANFSFVVQPEYIQIMTKPVSVDCSVYVCNGNPRCLQLLTQYASVCRTVEEPLQLNARLEALELTSMIVVQERTLNLGVSSNFNHTFDLSAALPPRPRSRSAIEDLLFDKVVTSGLGTVDEDYKACAARMANTIAEAGCVQYYNGIMVLPGVVDPSLLSQYTAALTGAMVLGGVTAGVAIPFSLAVQSRLNYLALQTDVLQRNQMILAQSFNAAMGNITIAFGGVSNAIQQTVQSLTTIAQALNKVENVVNEQGTALSQLTKQLASNFQAISSSIEDLYNRLDSLEADQQVDRLITGRLAALNAFVTQQLLRYSEVRSSRQLAQEKINECVKSQSSRYGFCGNGTHVFSVANAAPDGIMFLHANLVPTSFIEVSAFAGVCVDGRALVLRGRDEVLFLKPGTNNYLITPRLLFEPRVPVSADFVEVSSCNVTFVNLTVNELPELLPDYIDVNKTLKEFAATIPNRTEMQLTLNTYNATVLNLTDEVNSLTLQASELTKIASELNLTISKINNTLVELEWLNRVETYIKWPWYVWLAISVTLIILVGLMLWCCLATGCCGCCSCLVNSCSDCGGKRLQRYEIEKIHVQ
uniref:Spike protein n=1 Tax=Miniopterus bat coronavirus/Kenya/KY27/2006 TaxID=983926 RepID=F1DB07_9ALPC|nr:spike protein [Miniopterus bat coronavirus/Kenya/KY27/2006]